MLKRPSLANFRSFTRGLFANMVLLATGLAVASVGTGPAVANDVRIEIGTTPCIDPGHLAGIRTIWEGGPGYPGRLAWLKEQINVKLPSQGSRVLYETQVFTNNLLDYARTCRDVRMIDQLAGVYLTAIPHLATIDPGTIGAHREWKDTPTAARENPLKSAQFVYLMARMTNTIGKLPATARTPQMNAFVASYHRIILVDHIRRWVFARNADHVTLASYKTFGAAWSTCANKGRYTHHEWLAELMYRRAGATPDYCNVVRDLDLWVIAAAAEMIEARDLLGPLIPVTSMTSAERGYYTYYVRRGVALIQSRLTPTVLKNFQNQDVPGLNFDAGLWKNHPDYYYAGYALPTKPTLVNRKPVAGIGWDISHARRFVQVFGTLYEKRIMLGTMFPTRDHMVRFANQFAYGVFNKNLSQPLFRNYFDGTVGWYRVNYGGNTDLAYPPYGSSNAALNGGYGFWSAFNPDIKTIMKASLNALGAPSVFREKYYNHNPGTNSPLTDPDYFYKWNRFDLNAASSLDYLQFYPTLVNAA